MFGTPSLEYGKKATIAASGTTSGAVDLEGLQLLGFIMPASLTGTTMTLTMSTEIAGTYVTVQDGDGADLSFAITASKYIPVPNLSLTRGLKFVKVVSGSSEAAAREIVLVCGDV